MFRAKVVRSLVLASFAFALAGCEDFSRFSTLPDEAYCGAVTLGSEFRQGVSPRVQMSLTLDATKLDGPGSPGTITTFEADEEGSEKGARMLDGAFLRVITPIEHDPISRLTFGDGRDRSAMYAVSPSNGDDAAMIAVLSLMHDDTAQVRLLRPGRAGVVGGDNGQIYGLFALARRTGGCGF
jgi:hypothetical protein